MAQKIKHGRQAIDRLIDGLKIVYELIEEIRDSLLPPNIPLIADDAQAALREILDLHQFVNRQLDPMLARREQAQTTEELAAQLRAQLAAHAALAVEVADLRDRLAILERSHVPDRARKGGDA